MSDQIVYTTQSNPNNNHNNDSSLRNSYYFTSDQLRVLNLLMPLGYTLISRSKLPSQIFKKNQTSIFDVSTKRIKPVPIPQTKIEISQPIQKKIVIQQKVLSPDMTKCLRILIKLKKHPKSILFHLPVDTFSVPDYLSIVSEPMDFSTVEENINKNAYISINQFIIDIRKIWSNAYLYNAKESPIYLITMEMEKYFNKTLQEENIYSPNPQTQIKSQVVVEKIIPKQIKPEPAIIKKKPPPPIIQNQMTLQQKRNLGALIKKLPREHLRGVWEIVSNYDGKTPVSSQLQFDIQALSVKQARALQQYVKQVFNNIDFRMKQDKLKQQQQQSNMQVQSDNESSFLISDDDD